MPGRTLSTLVPAARLLAVTVGMAALSAPLTTRADVQGYLLEEGLQAPTPEEGLQAPTSEVSSPSPELTLGTDTAANDTTVVEPGGLRLTLLAAASKTKAKPKSGSASSGASGDDGQSHPTEKPAPKTAAEPKPQSLDFDLLGAAPAAPTVDDHALKTRRTMLSLHQGFGIGMLTLDLATTVVGQLNYLDKFSGGNTGRYEKTHAVLAYSTLAAFVATGALALLAPSPGIERRGGFDRVSLHKLAMFTAAAGMAAQGVLGIMTREREGYLNQQNVATAHLVIGYVTFAAIAVGVGALVF